MSVFPKERQTVSIYRTCLRSLSTTHHCGTSDLAGRIPWLRSLGRKLNFAGAYTFHSNVVITLERDDYTDVVTRQWLLNHLVNDLSLLPEPNPCQSRSYFMVHGVEERAGTSLWIIIFCSKTFGNLPVVDRIEEDVLHEVFRLDIYMLANFLPETAHGFVGRNSLSPFVEG